MAIYLDRFFFLLLRLRIHAFRLTILPLRHPIRVSRMRNKRGRRPRRRGSGTSKILRRHMFKGRALRVLPLRLSLILVISRLFKLSGRHSNVILVSRNEERRVLPKRVFSIRCLRNCASDGTPAHQVRSQDNRLSIRSNFRPQSPSQGNVSPRGAGPIHRSKVRPFSYPTNDRYRRVVVNGRGVRLLRQVRFHCLLLRHFQLPFPRCFLRLSTKIRGLRGATVTVLHQEEAKRTPCFRCNEVFLFRLSIRRGTNLTASLMVIAASVDHVFIQASLPICRSDQGTNAMNLGHGEDSEFQFVNKSGR